MMKENYMRTALRDALPNITMVFNKQVDGGCSGRRPDVRIECLTHSIIIECDEHRHSGYSCENKRIMQLFVDCGRRPIVVLRFNPDRNDASPGCFVSTTRGYRVLKPEWERRTAHLVERVEHHLTIVPCATVSSEQLFY
jgi:hypothetical protein